MKRLRHHPIRLGLLMLLAVGQLAFASDDPKPAAKAAWQWQKTPAPLALVANGLWWESFHVDAALDKAGTRQRKEFKNLSQYSVIVLVNAQVFRLPKGAVDEIREFVNQGGGLVVLGGLYTLGQGDLKDTLLEPLLPVELSRHDVHRAEKPLALAAVAGDVMARAVSFTQWKLSPVLYWQHAVKPKPGAHIHILAGEEPVLISWKVGKGRVVVFTGTALGEGQEGELPFWKWGGWPMLLNRMIGYATEQTP